MEYNNSDNILYFPSLNPPKDDWFKIAFLYYDTIYTISPPNFIAKNKINSKYRHHYNEQTTWLAENGFISLLMSFDNEYDKKLFSDKIEPIYGKIEENKSIYLDELSKEKLYKIYWGKFSPDIISRLDDLDLVKKVFDKNDDYYPSEVYIPESIGQVLMYKLADTLGELDYCTPSTDIVNYRFELTADRNPLLNRELFKEIVLPSLFQIPDNISFEELLKFKRTYEEELINFRKLVDEEIAKLSFVVDNKVEYLEHVVNSLVEEQKRLERVYKDAGIGETSWGTRMNVIKMIGGAATKRPGTFFSGLMGLMKRVILPERRNKLTFPALYNYNYNKST